MKSHRETGRPSLRMTQRVVLNVYYIPRNVGSRGCFAPKIRANKTFRIDCCRNGVRNFVLTAVHQRKTSTTGVGGAGSSQNTLWSLRLSRRPRPRRRRCPTTAAVVVDRGLPRGTRRSDFFFWRRLTFDHSHNRTRYSIVSSSLCLYSSDDNRSTERSFLILKRIKSYLRSNTDRRRLFA